MVHGIMLSMLNRWSIKTRVSFVQLWMQRCEFDHILSHLIFRCTVHSSRVFVVFSFGLILICVGHFRFWNGCNREESQRDASFKNIFARDKKFLIWNLNNFCVELFPHQVTPFFLFHSLSVSVCVILFVHLFGALRSHEATKNNNIFF